MLQVEERKQLYLDSYDVVLIKDETLDVPNAVLRYLTGTKWAEETLKCPRPTPQLHAPSQVHHKPALNVFILLNCFYHQHSPEISSSSSSSNCLLSSKTDLFTEVQRFAQCSFYSSWSKSYIKDKREMKKENAQHVCTVALFNWIIYIKCPFLDHTVFVMSFLLTFTLTLFC